MVSTENSIETEKGHTKNLRGKFLCFCVPFFTHVVKATELTLALVEYKQIFTILL